MHRFETPIRLGLTDAAGVVYFARVFDLAHVAYEDFLDAIGHPLPPELRFDAAGMPVVEARARYTAPLRLGDRAVIAVRITELGSTTFTTESSISVDGAVHAVVTLKHVMIVDGARAPLPSALHEALAGHLTRADGASSPQPDLP